ncbi:MAG: hypothetical protein ACLPVY_15185 [Acidimicrobiia bacterium]
MPLVRGGLVADAELTTSSPSRPQVNSVGQSQTAAGRLRLVRYISSIRSAGNIVDQLG